MVEVSIDGDVLRLRMKGLHKLWAVKSSLEIPLGEITEVKTDPTAVRAASAGVRILGSYFPDVIAAGTFLSDGKSMFVDVGRTKDALRLSTNTVAIQRDHTSGGFGGILGAIIGDSYHLVVVEVEDPDAVVTAIEEALALRRARQTPAGATGNSRADSQPLSS